MKTFVLVFALFVSGCATVPLPPPDAEPVKGDPVAMYCEDGGAARISDVDWGGVRCTALNVGDYTPYWETYVAPILEDATAHYTTYGQSVSLPIGRVWTLIVMRVTDGVHNAQCSVWARKPSPTSVPQLLKPEAGEIAPGRMR